MVALVVHISGGHLEVLGVDEGGQGVHAQKGIEVGVFQGFFPGGLIGFLRLRQLVLGALELCGAAAEAGGSLDLGGLDVGVVFALHGLLILLQNALGHLDLHLQGGDLAVKAVGGFLGLLEPLCRALQGLGRGLDTAHGGVALGDELVDGGHSLLVQTGHFGGGLQILQGHTVLHAGVVEGAVELAELLGGCHHGIHRVVHLIQLHAVVCQLVYNGLPRLLEGAQAGLLVGQLSLIGGHLISGLGCLSQLAAGALLLGFQLRLRLVQLALGAVQFFLRLIQLAADLHQQLVIELVDLRLV